MNAKVYLIFGRKMKGKGTLAFHLAKRLDEPIFIFDPNRQFHNGAVVSNCEDFADVVEGEVVGRGDVVIYQPMAGLEENFDCFASAIMTQRNLAVVIDEAARLMSPSGISQKLDDLLRASGDHQLSLSIFMTQHRPQDVNGIAFEMADRYIFFATKHPLSLKKVEAYTNAEVAERVSHLEDRDFLLWSVEDEDYYIEKDSGSWFEDLRPSTQEDAIVTG